MMMSSTQSQVQLVCFAFVTGEVVGDPWEATSTPANLLTNSLVAP
jgi:hypothetical protein